MRRALCLAGSFCLLAWLAGESGAQSAETEQRWYGWQIAAVDAPLVAVAALSTDGGGEASLVAVAGLLVSGPIIHGGHGEGGAAVGSAISRVAFPALGALLGSSTGRGEHEEGSGHTALEGAAVGALGGYAVALAIDLVLARTEVELPERAPSASPTVMVGSSSATVGLAGNF